MPTRLHQRILAYLFRVLCPFVEAGFGGEALCAPLPVRLFPGTIREPDIVYLSPNRSRRDEEYPTGADFALEIVSPDAERQNRDYVEKRRDYAKAGIPEYWIVDPQEKKITVLVLDGDAYRQHGVFGPGTSATSVLLAGFSVKVDDVLAAAEGPKA